MEIMSHRVFVDANVLYSKTTRDWLFHLRIANEGLFQLHCTEDVFAEAVHHLRKNHPRWAGARVAALSASFRTIMDEVLEDFPSTIPFTGTDEGDYHVHAAAVHSRADLLLTNNRTSDFTAADDESYEVITPDDFFMLVASSAPAGARAALEGQIDHWKSRSSGVTLDEALEAAGCPLFAAKVRELLREKALRG